MEQQQPAAPATAASPAVLTEAQMSEAQACGSRFSRNRSDRILIASDMAASMGTAPTFEQWEAHRRWFIDGYTAENPQNTAAAADTAWAEFAKLLDGLFGLTKPKSTSAAAERKATERSQKREELLAAYQTDDAHDVREKLQAAYQTAASDPTNKNAQKAIKNLTTVLKAKTADEDKAKREELAELKKQVRAAVADCESIETLEQALACFD
jgi:hypothetical protein